VDFLVVLIELSFANCYSWGATSKYRVWAVARSFCDSWASYTNALESA